MAALDLVAIYESSCLLLSKRHDGKDRTNALEEDGALDKPRFGRPAARGDMPSPAEPILTRDSVGSQHNDSSGSEQAEGGRQSRRAGPRQPPSTRVHGAGRYRSGVLHHEPEEQDGVLGTWAARQRLFPDHLRRKREEEAVQQQQQQQAAALAAAGGAAGAAAAAAGSPQGAGGQHVRRGESPPAAVPAVQPGPQQHPVENSLDQELNAAWRWRFTRKWQAEQMKQFEPPPAAGGAGAMCEAEDEEEWSAALRLMDAVDGGLNLQIGRTLSLQNGSMVDGADMSMADQSLTLMSPGLSQYMLLDSSIKESPLREEAAAATSHIVSVARKAQHLRQQQQEIERQVSERWEVASGGGQWVAQHLPAVQIDSWSAFPFVLVRLSEQRGHRQKLLVRGRNGAAEQQMFAIVEQEAARVAIAHRLPGPRVELVASGRMEWVATPPGQGQRRTLRIKASRLHPPAAKDSRLRSIAGTSGVVAELTRASFPSGDFDIVAHGSHAATTTAASGSK